MGLMLLLGLAIGTVAGAANPELVAGHVSAVRSERNPAGADEWQTLAVFWEAWRIIRAEFLDRTILDDRRLAYGAIRGLVQSLEDPNTRFRTPQERQVELVGYRGRLDGIGVYLDLRDGHVTVSALIEGGPAAAADVRPGDLILAVDGQPTAGWSSEDAALRIRGPQGTSVTLTLVRTNVPTPIAVTLVRAEVRLISARARMLDSGIGLLRVTAFTEGTNDEVGEALADLRRQGARALVLDLRGNPGGLLEPAVAFASRFVPVGPIVWREDGQSERRPYERDADQPSVEWPVVAVVDRGTASAAEVVAAALRDGAGVRLVGQRTHGKGTVQYIHELSDGSGLHVTAARWISPAGTRLDRAGLDPNLVVDAPQTDAADPALDAAVGLLHHLVPAAPTGVRDSLGATGGRGPVL